eukprot:SAG31_NODE_3901_length_3770_cov_4.494416_2_plen_73_part_00
MDGLLAISRDAVPKIKFTRLPVSSPSKFSTVADRSTKFNSFESEYELVQFTRVHGNTFTFIFQHSLYDKAVF